jgi:hypothetical protein
MGFDNPRWRQIKLTPATRLCVWKTYVVDCRYDVMIDKANELTNILVELI